MTNDTLKREYLELLQEKERRARYNKLDSLFPEDGPYARDKYKKHMAFMAAGKKYRQRAFIASNRCGKTFTGAAEVAYHLTGEYPAWWEGRRFDTPVNVWVASLSNAFTKDVAQKILFGNMNDLGSGFIPKACIEKITKKAGVTDAIETGYIRHNSGNMSVITFKAYEQGREAFQGDKVDVIWLDEEPKDASIYTECITRTAGDTGNEGLILCTFTPLLGLSKVVQSFLPGGKFPHNNVNPLDPYKYIMHVDWDDVPHLSAQWKEEALKSYAPYERDARSKGIPSLGAGAVYPYSEDGMLIAPFELPVWWPRTYGMDVGWGVTAIIWIALDPDAGVYYLYSEHYGKEELPAITASAIKARGEWVIGAIDPASDTRRAGDGARLLELYQAEGLDLVKADNSVEAGIAMISQLMAANRFKVFNTLQNWLAEFRIYRREQDTGKIAKNQDDHAMDAMRYGFMSGLEYARVKQDDYNAPYDTQPSGRNNVTGY